MSTVSDQPGTGTPPASAAWSRLFLVFVGMAYVGLAGWCSFDPPGTAKAVGFQLYPGSGQSEFLVVYGGLELGLGLSFLIPLIDRSSTGLILRVCVLIHVCLVLFRTASFAIYSGFGATTLFIAAAEWVILVTGAVLLWFASCKPLIANSNAR